MTPSEVGRRFNQHAAGYGGRLTAFIGERELRAVRPFVPAASDVLDYGCGTGRTTLDLVRRGCRVTGYDISAGMLAVARNALACEGHEAELTADEGELAGRTWPVVTAIGVLDYYRDPVPVVRQLASYVAPAGRLVATFPNGHSPLAWLYALGSRWTVPAHPATPAAARRAAEEAGLRVCAVRYAFPAVPLVGHTLVLALAAE